MMAVRYWYFHCFNKDVKHQWEGDGTTMLYEARRARVYLYTDTHIAVEPTKDFWQ